MVPLVWLLREIWGKVISFVNFILLLLVWEGLVFPFVDRPSHFIPGEKCVNFRLYRILSIVDVWGRGGVGGESYGDRM